MWSLHERLWRRAVAIASTGRVPANPARSHNKRPRARATISRFPAAPMIATSPRYPPLGRWHDHGSPLSIIFFPLGSLARSKSNSAPSHSTPRRARESAAIVREYEVGRPFVPPRDSSAHRVRPKPQRTAAYRDMPPFPRTTLPANSPIASQRGNLPSAAIQSWREFQRSPAPCSQPTAVNSRCQTSHAGGDGVESGTAPLT